MRRNQENEWVSIGDFMGGVIAVLVVLFVIAILKNRLNEFKNDTLERNISLLVDSLNNDIFLLAKERDSLIADKRPMAIRIAEENITDKLFIYKKNLPVEVKDMLIVDSTRAFPSLILRKGTFKSNRAYIEPEMRNALSEGKYLFKQLLEDYSNLVIFVTGHSDSTAVRKRGITTYGAFNDNIELSSRRAESARNIIINNWPEELKERVGMSGYGQTKPLYKGNFYGENRRVEIVFELIY